MRPFRTREEALIYFTKNNPMSQCDYFIEIETNDGSQLDSMFCLHNFTFPQCGITYNNEFGFPHPVPSAQFGSITVSYIPLRTDNINIMYQSNFNQLWTNQFTLDGLLKFIPKSRRPTVYVYTLSASPELVFIAEGCVFTYPTPSISYSSDSVSINTVEIHYEDAAIYATNVGSYNPESPTELNTDISQFI